VKSASAHQPGPVQSGPVQPGPGPVGSPAGNGPHSRAAVYHAARKIVAEAPDDPEVVHLRRLHRQFPLLSTARARRLVALAANTDLGYGVLDEVLGDASVNEVMVNGPGEVWVERDGRLQPSGLVVSRAEIQVTIERIIDPLGLRVDHSQPFVDARLRDGSRVHIVVPPLAPEGPLITVRRFGSAARSVHDFGPPALVGLFRRLVDERATMLVVGGTSTGKTSLVGALAAMFDPDERVVLLEDTAELSVPGNHVVRLECRPPNSEGVGAVALRDLIHNALRMRPDRLIVGEVRGPEALDLVLALNTGHEGSLATCHANSASEALLRLETLAGLAAGETSASVIRRQLIEALDVIVEVERVDGTGVVGGPVRRVRRAVQVSVTHCGPQPIQYRDLWTVSS